MARQTNLAVVAQQEPAEVVADVAATEPSAPAEKPRKPELIGGDIEDVGPPPANLIKKSLGELISEIPVGGIKSRVITGTSDRGVRKAATGLGLTVVTQQEGEATRVWVTGPVAAPAAAVVADEAPAAPLSTLLEGE